MRPQVICHMVPSIDGRILTKRWNMPAEMHAEYEATAATFDADAWMIGRVSMEPYAGKGPLPKRAGGAKIARKDFVAPHEAESFAIALDPSGKLRWKSGRIDDEHVITVLTESVSDDYLAFLQKQGVSYVFGGKSALDLKKVLEKLAKLFGIRKLLLEGGGKINGSFLAAGLIDELSILLAPFADGAVGIATLFDSPDPKSKALPAKLLSVEKRSADLVWLRYRLARSRK